MYGARLLGLKSRLWARPPRVRLRGQRAGEGPILLPCPRRGTCGGRAHSRDFNRRISCVCLLLLLSVGGVRAQDAFDAIQRAAQALSPPGVTCTLSLPDGKTQFRQGELIPVTLSFTSDRPGAYQMSRWSFGPSEAFHISPSEGVADPMAEERGGPYSYEGPPPPAPLPITGKPVAAPLLLNQWLRFDRPGAYRLYVTSSRVLDGKAKTPDPFGGGKSLPAVSNLVSFTVVPADLAWAHAQAQGALAEVLSHSREPITVASPYDVLTYLGTPESARALLAVMATDTHPRSSESEGRWCRTGLIGFPDQAWLIGEMRRDLTAPDYAVSQTFLQTLDTLAARQKAMNGGPVLHDSWIQAADAVPAKSPKALPMTLHTLLETAWLTNLGNDKTVQARLPGLTRRMALVFDRLPPLPQSYLLGDDWTWLRTPILLPALRRLWAAAVRPENNDFERNDLILRRLYDLSPAEGRALILKECSAPYPRATAAALCILPDATLPALNETLKQHLTDGNRTSDLDMTCQLIARYGTPALFPVVRAFSEHDQSPTSATNLALLAYFLRVRPDSGAVMTHRELAHALGRGRSESLLADLATERYDPRLERIALAALDEADPGIAADAARTLGQHGSPHTEAALWARLRRQDNNGKSREVVEEALTEALTLGQNWYESQARLAQIRALCVTPSGKRRVDEALARTETGAVHLDYQISDAGWWTVGRYNGRGRGEFLAKMAQFPRGTVFSWQDINVGQEAERLFTQTKTFAQARGLTLTRWRPPTGGAAL